MEKNTYSGENIVKKYRQREIIQIARKIQDSGNNRSLKKIYRDSEKNYSEKNRWWKKDGDSRKNRDCEKQIHKKKHSGKNRDNVKKKIVEEIVEKREIVEKKVKKIQVMKKIEKKQRRWGKNTHTDSEKSGSSENNINFGEKSGKIQIVERNSKWEKVDIAKKR